MFGKKKKQKLFEEKIDQALEKLDNLEPGSEEYKRQAEAIQCLMTMKVEKETQSKRNITSWGQTGLVVAANLIIFGVAIAFEQNGKFFPSRWMQFFVKTKTV